MHNLLSHKGLQKILTYLRIRLHFFLTLYRTRYHTSLPLSIAGLGFKEKKDCLKKQLKINLESLQSSIDVLNHSYEKCSKIDLYNNYTFDNLESFEALTSRFSRTSDILTQKVLKSLFIVIGESPKTFIDGINLLEKSELISNADILFEIRQLRNEISHKYRARDINTLFNETLQKTPALIEIIDDIDYYIKNNLTNY